MYACNYTTAALLIAPAQISRRGTVKSSEAAAGSNPREFARSPLCLLGVLTRFLRERAAGVLSTAPRLSFGMIPNGKKEKNSIGCVRLTRWFLISEAAETLTQIHARSISFLAAVLPQTQFDLLFLFFLLFFSVENTLGGGGKKKTYGSALRKYSRWLRGGARYLQSCLNQQYIFARATSVGSGFGGERRRGFH